MDDPILGYIAMVAFNFAPLGWAFCNGQLLSIAQNEALFSLLGTTYGGDGITTFALPDLRGRFPVHAGQGTGLSPYVLGQVGGSESVSLTSNQLPSHAHVAQGLNAAGSSASPSGAVWAGSTTNDAIYQAQGTPAGAMQAPALGTAGGSNPHENRMPFLAINFIISLEGFFPSQN